MNGRVGTLFLAAFATVLLIGVSPVRATLNWYYNPLTGNVSFDSTDTRSGGLYSYAFEIYASPPAFTFRTENFVHLTNSSFYTDTPTALGEGSLSTSLNGLYTIGDILPAGLSQQAWNSFTYLLSTHTKGELYAYNYADVIGGGTPPEAQFIYGAPTGDFKNKWDLLNPDTLKWAKTATLVYQPWDGKVYIDTTGETSGFITGYVLQSNGQLLPDGFTPDVTGPFSTATASTMGTFADVIEPGVHTVGEVLEPGLSLSQFESKFTSAQFVARAGYPGQSFDFASSGISFAFEMAAIPEPPSMLLAASGLIAICFGNFGGRRER